MNGLREIAARSLQGFYECGCSQFFETFERVFAFVTRGAIGTAPVVQEKIFAAQTGNAGAFKN